MKKMCRLTWFACFVVILITANLTGCASLRKKFIRKKKKPKDVTPHYYSIQKYDILPSIELYTKHYVFWRSWHNEIIELLGENSKKDKRCIDEMVGNLEDMKTLLVDEKGEELERHIQVLRGIEKDIAGQKLTFGAKTRVRRVLEKQFKLIRINFTYRKMDPFIRAEFKKRDNTE